MPSGVAGVAVADAGMGLVAGAVQADPVVHVPTFDPLDVAGDFTQHCAAPRNLGRVHSRSPKQGVGDEGDQTRIFDSTSPDVFFNVDDVDL